MTSQERAARALPCLVRDGVGCSLHSQGGHDPLCPAYYRRIVALEIEAAALDARIGGKLALDEALNSGDGSYRP